MKLIHLADLHIGKRVNEFSMLEDQKYILSQILNIFDDLKPDGILIAGDVYDKALPPAEAVEVLDDFLTAIARRRIPCFVISGNHDSPERLAFGARIMAGQQIHMSPVFQGEITSLVLEDENGSVNVYLLPFLKPAQVRRFYPEAEIDNYEEAVRIVLANSRIDPSARNVLLAHQFITSGGLEPERCESESISVGGLDNIDASLFAGFDYVALGHLHGPQAIGRETVRYVGSPLKYSFSETRHTKTVTVVGLGPKGEVQITALPLVPLRDLREIKGPLRELLRPENYAGTNTEDYMHVTLTDEEDILDAIGKVHTVYPHVMRLDYDNKRTKGLIAGTAAGEAAQKSPLELFREFYKLQNNTEMDAARTTIVRELLAKLGEDEA
jgi:exonuclease SbcD